MLTQDEKDAIDAGREFADERGALSQHALASVQNVRGWISNDTLKDIAGYLGLSEAELDGVATFYNRIYRCPVGRHVILLCDSVSCWIMDSENLRDYLFVKLGISAFGQTTADGRFTLLPSACLGACDHAPAMMMDRQLHGDLTRQRIDEIIDSYADEPSPVRGVFREAGSNV